MENEIKFVANTSKDVRFDGDVEMTDEILMLLKQKLRDARTDTFGRKRIEDLEFVLAQYKKLKQGAKKLKQDGV